MRRRRPVTRLPRIKTGGYVDLLRSIIERTGPIPTLRVSSNTTKRGRHLESGYASVRYELKINKNMMISHVARGRSDGRYAVYKHALRAAEARAAIEGRLVVGALGVLDNLGCKRAIEAWFPGLDLYISRFGRLPPVGLLIRELRQKIQLAEKPGP